MDASSKKKVIADIYWRGKQRKLHSKRYVQKVPIGGGGSVECKLSSLLTLGNVRNNCNFEFRFVSIYET